MTGETADQLLTRLAETYAEARFTYRDRLLECGRLAMRYVALRMAEGTGYVEACREVDAKIGRAVHPDGMAGRTNATSTAAHTLIGTARVVEFFGDPGKLSFRSVRICRTFLVCDRKTKLHSVRPGIEREAAEFYTRAAAEGFNGEVVLVESSRIRGRATKSRAAVCAKLWRETKLRHVRDHQAVPASARDQAAVASPGDVAEMCMNLVRASADPRAVAQCLLPKLQEVAAAKHRPSLEELLGVKPARKRGVLGR